MAKTEHKVLSGKARSSDTELSQKFADLHPVLDDYEASVAADRCYFCYDAPCVTACPTAIDVPTFIRQIATGMPKASAMTILEQNILGGMCARVCPTETLCEQACVREKSEGKPVEIGRLQRYATDSLIATGEHPFERQKPTNKKVAVLGAGPAGLSAAHRLAMLGHSVDIFDLREKLGGLNEYGVAAYKATDQFAQKEIEWLLKIGGIKVQKANADETNIELQQLLKDYDAVFMGIGLGAVRKLSIPGEQLANVENAIDFIARLRQAKNLSSVKTGQNVVVIGGGMTAIDAAVQSKLLGADEVTLVYRKEQEKMPASRFEQELAKKQGVRFIYEATPKELQGNEKVQSIKFDRNTDGESFELNCDHVLKAIGQTMAELTAGFAFSDGKIEVDENFKTSVAKVWAGGDCVSVGEDLTVTAVAHGRDAAQNIHDFLMGDN